MSRKLVFGAQVCAVTEQWERGCRARDLKKMQLIPISERKSHSCCCYRPEGGHKGSMGCSSPRPPGPLLSDCSGSNTLVLIPKWAELLAWEAAIEMTKTP